MVSKGKKKIKNPTSGLEENVDKEPVEEDYGLDDDAVPKWYEAFTNEPTEFVPLPEEEVSSLRLEAEQILENETKFYHSKLGKGKHAADTAWIKTVLLKGTSKDKVAANVITVQNGPIYNISALSTLINMVKASKKSECTLVMESLADLFLEDLLKPNLKLKMFDRQPLDKLGEITSGCARARRTRMAAWMFEEKLKEHYLKFIQALEVVSRDTVESMRIKAVTAMSKLLAGNPEQEQLLLKNVINKLGDPSPKVVSKVTYCITQLLRVHPAMKQVVMNEIEKLIFRPNVNTRTQYYAVCLLTQFIFRDKDREIARNIINIYFSFFKAAVKKADIESKLMGALLMGVKRAYPYSKLTPEIMQENIDTLYKLVHLSTFNISLHALCLLQEVSTESDDRFYSALYKQLLDPGLSKSCHHSILINLLYKAIVKDSNVARVKAVIKRIFQICFYLPVPLVCGFLYLISELFSQRRVLLAFQTDSKEGLKDIKKIEEFSDDDGEEKYDDVEKIEVINVDDIKIESEDKESASEECKGIPIDFDKTIEIKEEEENDIDSKPNLTSGWVFRNFEKKSTLRQNRFFYDPLARNPGYARADQTAYFELINLAAHFHPTVSLFAKKLLTCEKICYSGDPLVDFTLVRFLDRFCYKNPKTTPAEPKGPDPTLAGRKYYEPTGIKAVPVMSSEYLSHDVKDIPVDELFLFKYLKERHGEGSHLNRLPDDDNESVASEEFEEILDNMIGGKKGTRDLDFMEDIGNKLKNKTKDEDSDVYSESEDEVSSEEEISEEKDKGNDDDEDDDDDDDDEVLDFSDDGLPDEEIDIDDVLDDSSKTKSKRKKEDKFLKSKKKALKKSKNDLEGLFAPAEEFAEILEEAGSSKEKPGMISSLANTDNSAPKQLSWELKRDRWMKDINYRHKRKFRNDPQKGNKRKRF